jgi:hypothetical protein
MFIVPCKYVILMQCFSIVPPKKEEPVNKGAKFNRNNSNTIHSDEKVKIVVKNDQFGKKEKETKKKYVP